MIILSQTSVLFNY